MQRDEKIFQKTCFPRFVKTPNAFKIDKILKQFYIDILNTFS